MSEDAPQKDGKPKPKAGKKLKLRSLSDLDARTTAARRALEVRDSLLSDLGGADHASTAQRQLATRGAVLGAILEDQEHALLKGEEIALDNYATLINAQRRVLSDLGIERRARDVTPPTVEAYLAHKRQQEAAE